MTVQGVVVGMSVCVHTALYMPPMCIATYCHNVYITLYKHTHVLNTPPNVPPTPPPTPYLTPHPQHTHNTPTLLSSAYNPPWSNNRDGVSPP